MRRIAVLASLPALFAACWYEVGEVEPSAVAAASAAGTATGGASSVGQGAGGAGAAGGDAGAGGAPAGTGGGAGGSVPVGDFLECELLGYAGKCVGNELLIYFSAPHACNAGSATGHCILNRCGISGTCGVVTCDGTAENAVCLPERAPTFIDCANGVGVEGDCVDGVAVRRDGLSCSYSDCVALGATCKEPPDVGLAGCYAQ